MFDSGDIVEEIATGRKGRVALSTVWPKFAVHFLDGKKPPIKSFEDLSELCFIERPGETGPPRLIPKNWIV
ncbi:MAG: hypothetical protein WDN23_00895 [Edaphobacter sp.]